MVWKLQYLMYSTQVVKNNSMYVSNLHSSCTNGANFKTARSGVHRRLVRLPSIFLLFNNLCGVYCAASSNLLLQTKTSILGFRNILKCYQTIIKSGSINAYCKANCTNVLQNHVCALIGQFWPWHLAYKGHRAKAIKLKLVEQVSTTSTTNV